MLRRTHPTTLRCLPRRRWLRLAFHLCTLLIVCSFYVLPRQLFAQSDPCPEPNDTLASACSLDSGAIVYGTLNYDGDIDVYRVIASSSGQIRAELVDLPADYDLYLSDVFGEVIGQSVHEGIAPELIQLTVQSGTYYLTVRADPARPIDASHPYKLSFVFLPSSQSTGSSSQPSGSGTSGIVLDEHFDDTNTRRLPHTLGHPDGSQREVGYSDGEYVTRITIPMGRNAVVAQIPGMYTDVSIDVDVRIVGPSEGRAIQVLCRASPGSNSNRGYIAYISLDGEYSIGFSDGVNRTQLLVNGTASDSIHQANDLNHLQFICKGSTLSLSANGVLLIEVQDDHLSSGQIALVAYTGDGGTVDARWDNLLVRSLVMPPTPAATRRPGGSDGSDIVFSENFDDSSSKRLPHTLGAIGANDEVGYLDNEYVTRTLIPNAPNAVSAQVPGTYTDVHIEVDVRLVGDTEGRAIQIICRRSAGVGGYFATLFSSGAYTLSFVDIANQGHLLADSAAPETIQKGNQTNHVELICKGSSISLKVNNTVISEVQDNKWTVGQVLIGAGTRTTGLVEARWDNLVLRRS